MSNQEREDKPKTTKELLDNALPISHGVKTRIEPKATALSPVIPIPGRVVFTEAEKMKIQAEAAKEVFGK